ncbi:MAG: GNAT family N-acetyltransferase [Saprospiraceae bacterium]|nr:GNAT family N-acetyltransferase [Saprospiraceae bacterium]
MKLPPYDTFPNLSGNNILLREIQYSDLKHIVEISRYDAIPAKNVEEAAAMQEKINQNYKDGNSIHWGIADKSSNTIVGTCGYYRGLDKGEGELGCILLSQFMGHGYMTAAIQLAIQFGLNDIGLKRIFAITTQQNDKAIRLLERIGFVKIADLEDDEIEYEWVKTNPSTLATSAISPSN